MVKHADKILAKHMQLEAEWLISVINARLHSYFSDDSPQFKLEDYPAPSFKGVSPYTKMLAEQGLKVAERITFMLALSPHILPGILDVFFTKNELYDRGYTEFGGIKGNYFSGFIPTGETALFILAANDLYQRQVYLQMFEQDHIFAKRHILWLENPHPGEPLTCGALKISDDITDLMITGSVQKPAFNIEFPASKINTELDWQDLVLDKQTLDHLSEIKAWVSHGKTLMEDWNLKKWLKPGYKCLFYGPPGTGKTLAASLIGKQLQRDVYRIDLSLIVSKYIGETEKNLSKIFNRAANKDWILFFDEADALFGKRTEVSDSHDRYANQEVSFLLQKLEEHPGLVILSSNFKSNIDEAFARRFQSMIVFPMPKEKERKILWKKAISPKSTLDPSVDINKIAEQYELSGGSIVNAIRYASLMALRNDTNVIKNEWLFAGIRIEFRKAGKTL